MSAWARNMPADVRLEEQRPLTSRRTRSPQHHWLVRLRPWQLVPVFVAPVLAGETLKQGMVQARVISDPIKNVVTGWWLEFFVFYVRVGDLAAADVVRNALIDPVANSMAALSEAATVDYYHQVASAPSWAKLCLAEVVRAYWRDDGEAWDAYTIGGYPSAAVSGSGWWDSLLPESALPPPEGDDDWEQKWSLYVQMRRAKLTQATWEEFLSMSGVSTPPKLREEVEDFRIPELVRFVRDFTYPVPTVDMATGNVVAQLQWSLAERIAKRRFFAEPGFLLGVMCLRPKVYFQNQRTAAVDVALGRGDAWMPAAWDEDPHTSLERVSGVVSPAVGTGPVHGGSVDYVYDRRDIYMHGDQWLNIDLGAPPGSPGHWNLVGLPAADLSRVKYPALADATGLFSQTGAEYAKVDGIISLQIASRLVDTTA